MDVGEEANFSCYFRIGACFSQAILYVASLYVWNSPFNRDHPSTVKRRFLSAFLMMMISPFFVHFFSSENLLHKVSLWHLMGLRIEGLLNAVIYPLLLTVILFLGPIVMSLHPLSFRDFLNPRMFVPDITNIFWLRNHFVAPLSEEFTFRACMMPLLLQCMSPTTAILFCPLPFGIAHFHHMIERIRTGVPFKNAIILSTFQFTYTTVFGVYSAFLFYRTGHFISPFIAHAFCNYMGFPDFPTLMSYEKPLRNKFIATLVAGFIAWIILLAPLTSPSIYSNDVIWHE